MVLLQQCAVMELYTESSLVRVQVKNITVRDYIRRSTGYAALWNAGTVAAETAPSGSRFQTGIIRTKNVFLYVSPVLPMIRYFI